MERQRNTENRQVKGLDKRMDKNKKGSIKE